MDEPSYNYYQDLYDYSKTISILLKHKKNTIKIRGLFLEFTNVLHKKRKITYHMNYSFVMNNIDQHICNFLYICSKYKFPRYLAKIIRQIQRYQLHRQKT